MQFINIDQSVDYYLWAPTALTGSDLHPVRNCLVEIKDGLIVSLDNCSKSDIPELNACTKSIYLDEDMTLMPALIDVHVHLVLDGKDFEHTCISWEDHDYLQNRIMTDLKTTLQSGIGVIRDGGDCREINLDIRNLCRDDRYLAPHIIATGQALRHKEGYGAFLGEGYSTASDIAGLIDKLQELEVDQVKVIASGLVDLNSYGKVIGKQLCGEELIQIVEQSHRHGLKVMAHASTAEAIDQAVKTGVDSIEHGYFICSETLDLMAEKQTAWVPTVLPVAVQRYLPLAKDYSAKKINIISRIVEEQINKVAYAQKTGVLLGVGTDSGAAGVNHGTSLVEELQLYSRGLLSNRSVLQMATVNNAKITGLDGKFGVLGKGFIPQLIAVRGNPLQDLNALKQVAVHFVAI